MPTSEENFLKQLLEIFKIEAKEHLDKCSKELVELEFCTDSAEWDRITESVFRETHSLKGASRSVDFIDVESICQNLESIFKFLRDNFVELEKNFFDQILYAIDLISKLVEEEPVDDNKIEQLIETLASIHKDLKNNENAKSDEYDIDVQEDEEENAKTETKIVEQDKDLIEKTADKNYSNGKSKKKDSNSNKNTDKQKVNYSKKTSTKQVENDKIFDRSKSQYIRIPVARLNRLMLKLEDLLSIKLKESNTLELFNDLTENIKTGKKELHLLKSSMIQRRKLEYQLDHDNRINYEDNEKLLESLNWSENFLKKIEKQLFKFGTETKIDFRQNAEKIDDLMEELRKVLMLPFSTISDLFPKMVRDLARDEGKSIRLEIEGDDVEIDKRILDELKDPLIHLIRNSIDHGIETPDERSNANKNPEGIIKIKLSHESGNKIILEISDDGKGISADAVFEKAVKNNLVEESKEKELTDSQKINLIFESGISTSSVITDLSGRGLGLAIVKEKVDYLGGGISINTEPGNGTTFLIELPASLATFRGIIVICDKRKYIFPTQGVERVIRISTDQIKTLENKSVIYNNNIAIPIFHLTDILSIRDTVRGSKERKNYTVLILGKEKPIGIMTDELVREQEVMIKSLGSQLKHVSCIMGATILGDGKVANVLYLPELFKAASKVKNILAASGKNNLSEKQSKTKILIAEDSITSRMLLVNVLETAGYDVTSTVDGSEAYITLVENEFDLVVSDVDMPNMSGFELTKKIRSNDKLKDIPVILVTSLKSREDKEKGMDVGANAYIVKSSFKPETLLNTIKKFI